MEEKNKVATFDKAITAKRDELEAILKEKKASAGDASKIVATEKKERRARAELEALETAQQAAAYIPPEPTDRDELLQCLDKYEAEHRAKIEKIKAEISEADKEAMLIEKELQKAAEAVDFKSTISLSDRKEELQAVKRHLLEMLKRAEAMPVYPAGAIREEWDALCNRLLPEFENRLAEIRILADAYKAAADSIFQMQAVIMNARAEMSKRANGEYMPTVFTKGKTSEGLTISKTYLARLDSMFSPLSGQPI